jgi:hypothetical protein
MQVAAFRWQRRLRRIDKVFEQFLPNNRVDELERRDMMLCLDQAPADPGNGASVR